MSDTVTEKRWESDFNKESFPNQELKDVFDTIKAAVSAQPPDWAATFPQDANQGLYVSIKDDTLEFELPEVKYDPNDVF